MLLQKIPVGKRRSKEEKRTQVFSCAYLPTQDTSDFYF